MRERIAKLYIDNCFAKSLLVVGNEAEEFADQILSLINAERCVWKHEEVWYPCLYYTSCGKFYREEYAEDKPYCPFCGKRISIGEVKDGQG